MFRLSILALILSTIYSCMPIADESSTLSFWTDRAVEGGHKYVFVNDTYVGELSDLLEDPVCSQVGLVNYKMEQPEDLNISVYNSEGESIELGVVNLFSVSTGIKIKPTEDSKIFVDRSLDESCTLVYLNWN